MDRKKYRYKHQLFFVEGKKMTLEAINSNFELFTVVIREDSIEELEYLWQNLPQEKVFYLSPKEYNTLSTQATSEGIICYLKMDIGLEPFTPVSLLEKEKLEGPGILLEGIQDPGNMGTIIRTADWFGINNIICRQDTADITHPRTLRSTMGAFFRSKVSYIKEWDVLLRLLSDKVVIADLEGESTNTFSFTDKDFILLGNEAHGVSEQLRNSQKHRKVCIPGAGEGESLNVSIAAGICLYAWYNSTQKKI